MPSVSMPSALKPELMDAPDLPYGETHDALRELDRVHRRFGNRALWLGLDPWIKSPTSHAANHPTNHPTNQPANQPNEEAAQTLVDIGTGSGFVADRAVRRARASGRSLRAIGVDRKLSHLVIGRSFGTTQLRVVADALALPFADQGVDLATSTLFQHHFDDRAGSAIVAEMSRVARKAVVISDLRNSKLGQFLGGIVLSLLGCGPITSYDGRLSLEQAWSGDRALAAAPPGWKATVFRSWPFRWTLELVRPTVP